MLALQCVMAGAAAARRDSNGVRLPRPPMRVCTTCPNEFLQATLKIAAILARCRHVHRSAASRICTLRDGSNAVSDISGDQAAGDERVQRE